MQEIARDHDSVHTATHGIEVELDRLRDDPAQPGAPWELPRLVRSFRDLLRVHFELEEKEGGLLGSNGPASEPGAQQTVDSLIGEHREFERQLDRIVARLDGDGAPDFEAQNACRHELRHLFMDLARHESMENAVGRGQDLLWLETLPYEGSGPENA
jgi:hypothetical protein